MPRWFFVILLLAGFCGCAKPDLRDTIVQASSPGALANFRADLGSRFSGEQLQAFDTAVQELKLDAMNRDVAPAAAREQDMCAVVNGRTVRQAEMLGWQARRARLIRESALMTGLLEKERKQQAAHPSVIGAAHIQNEEDILVRLRTQLAETERQLAGWTETKG